MIVAIWRGWGILVIPALAIGGVCGLFIGLGLTELLRLDSGALAGTLMCAAVGGSATLACYGLQRLLELTDTRGTFVNKATGEEVVLKRGDSLFFIPVRWWTRIMAAICCVVVCVVLFSPLFGEAG